MKDTQTFELHKQFKKKVEPSKLAAHMEVYCKDRLMKALGRKKRKADSKIVANFMLNAANGLTAEDLKSPTTMLVLGKDISFALNVPAQNVDVIAVYSCPGDKVNCDGGISKRRRRLASVNASKGIFVKFAVVGPREVFVKAENSMPLSEEKNLF